ncbi:MAG: TolC family outer membrane protein [Alphaproteobacteria bacterium]
MKALRAITLLGFSVSALVLTGAASAEELKEIRTLKDAVSIGVLTNPRTAVVQNNRRATDEELNQAKALYLPSIDFNGDTGLEYSDDPGTRGGTDGDDTETMWRYDVGVTLTQMLFDGYETKYEVERQKNRIKSATSRVDETLELVGLNIVENYLEVKRQRALRDIQKENVAKHEEILTMIDDGASAGRSTQADVEQARARLANAKAQLANNTEQLRIAEAAFKREVGYMPGVLDMPIIPGTALAADLQTEINKSLAYSPTLDVLEADLEVAHSERMGTMSTFYPQVDFQLNARTGEDLGGVEGDDTSASALFVVNWNLYRGGADVARTKELVYRTAEAKERRAQTARSIEDEVRRTWASRDAARDRAIQFRAQAAANRQVVSAYLDQFNLSRRTLLDVLDAQNELIVSRSNMINNEYLEMFAIYRLLAVRGDLMGIIGVDAPSEAEL